MQMGRIIISRSDYRRLRELLLADPISHWYRDPRLRELADELDRAQVRPDGKVPPGVVGLNSCVTIENVATAEKHTYTIVMPDEANVEEDRISILAPIATALLGYRAGDEVSWKMATTIRRWRILKVDPAQAVA